MNRSVTLHTLILLVALAAAYMVWNKKPTPSDESKITVANFRSGLQRLSFESPTKTVILERKKDDTGAFTWVQVTTRPAKPAAADALAKDAKPVPPLPEEAAKTKKKAFKGNETAENTMESLATLMALRVLGTVDADQMKEYGLTSSNTTLKLLGDGTERTFLIGGTTYGNSDFYALDQADNRVYVFAGSFRQELEHADFRYVDRRITSIKHDKVEKIVVRAANMSRTLIQHGIYRNASARFWSLADSDQPNDFYKNWSKKLVGLQIQEFEGAPEGVTLKPVFSAELYGTGNQRERVNILRKDADSDGGSQYYVDGTHPRGIAKLIRSAADEIARDLDPLFSGEQPTATTAPAAAAPARNLPFGKKPKTP